MRVSDAWFLAKYNWHRFRMDRAILAMMIHNRILHELGVVNVRLKYGELVWKEDQ